MAGSLSSVPTSLTVNGVSASLYHDNTYAVTNGINILDGTNLLTAVANGTMTSTVREVLPASVNLRSDANGNLIWDGLKAYAYDCANQLTSVTVTNGFRTEYAYDGLGRRRVRLEYVWSGNGWTKTNEVRYVCNGLQVIQERDASNTPRVTYTRGLDLSGTKQGAGGIGGLLARTDSGGSAYYHADGNGNITMLINSAGTMQAKYLYDSYGNTLGMWGTLAAGNTYRFSSKEVDPRSGLYYYGYRYYEPNLQRWLNPDPLGEAGGINLYQFNYNNPLSYIDPTGKAPQPVSAIYDPTTGQSSVQYQPSQFGQGYGIGFHNPPKYPSPFFFAGGEVHLPFKQGAREGAIFVGHDKTHGSYVGFLKCALTNKKGGFFVGGAGKEGGFSQNEGAYNVDVGLAEIDLGIGGVGYIWDNNGEEGLFLYFETPASKIIGDGGFVGGGISF